MQLSLRNINKTSFIDFYAELVYVLLSISRVSGTWHCHMRDRQPFDDRFLQSCCEHALQSIQQEILECTLPKHNRCIFTLAVEDPKMFSLNLKDHALSCLSPGVLIHTIFEILRNRKMTI